MPGKAFCPLTGAGYVSQKKGDYDRPIKAGLLAEELLVEVWGGLGGSFLISRSVDGPGCWESWVGGRKQKTKNRGGAGAQPSEPVPVEEKNQILAMQFHELDSKPKSRE